MKSIRNIFRLFVLAGAMLSISANAQQVSTLYFLENAPMRHLINPAFQPAGDGYVNLTPLGYTSLNVGNNTLTMSDAIQNINGQTVTALHPSADRQQLLKLFKNRLLIDADATLDLLSFGFRHNSFGFVHINILERADVGIGIPSKLITMPIDGGMSLDGTNVYNLNNTTVVANLYTEISGGYSYEISDEWTVGGKIKALVGQVNATIGFKNLTLETSGEQWRLYGNGEMTGSYPTGTDINSLIPRGYGGAIDLGFTYKPKKFFQLTAAITDLGVMYWQNGQSSSLSIDTTFTGVHNLQYATYSNAENNYTFDTNMLSKDITNALEGYKNSLHTQQASSAYWRMMAPKLNVGLDFKLAKDIIGLGIVSKTRYYNGHVYEDIMVGAAVRPCKWFNLAASYALLNNGKYSNIGAGISLMPYDGINLTLAMDYIPTTYAYYDNKPIPYKTQGMNVALGISIVWGTNKVYVHESKTVNETYKYQDVDKLKHIKFREKDEIMDYHDSIIAANRQETLRELPTEVHDVLVEMTYGLKFKKNSPVLTNASKAKLNDAARVLIPHRDYDITVLVFSDDKMKNKENSKKLCQDRALNIIYYLAQHGVATDQLHAVGVGEEHALYPNQVKKGRELNNHVLFYIQ